METTQRALCPLCQRPLPQAGALCPYCGEPAPGSFHVRPLFLFLVLLIASAFGAGTVLANRFYQSKQSKLAQMWFGRGQAALAAGQAPAAIQDFRNALYYSHDNPAYRLQLAQALVAAHRSSEAQAYLLTLWQDEPSNSTVNLQLARLAATQSETPLALRYYHGAIYGLWPDGEAASRRQQTRLELIQYLLSLHHVTQADGELIALTPELPRDPAAHTKVGWLFVQAGDQARALEEFKQALRLDPRQPSALLGAGQAAFYLAQYREAGQFLERSLRAGQQDPQAQELLATTRLVLEWNPYARGVSSRQRALRIVQAFRQASQRLQQCAAAKGIILNSTPMASAGVPQPGAAAPPTAGSKPSPGLVARIFGKIRPGESPHRVSNATVKLNAGSQIQQLYAQAAQFQPSVRAYKLERDSQLADSVMGLVAQIEILTAQQCGPPKGPDLALLLLARQAEER